MFILTSHSFVMYIFTCPFYICSKNRRCSCRFVCRHSTTNISDQLCGIQRCFSWPFHRILQRGKHRVSLLSSLWNKERWFCATPGHIHPFTYYTILHQGHTFILICPLCCCYWGFCPSPSLHYMTQMCLSKYYLIFIFEFHF